MNDVLGLALGGFCLLGTFYLGYIAGKADFFEGWHL